MRCFLACRGLSTSPGLRFTADKFYFQHRHVTELIKLHIVSPRNACRVLFVPCSLAQEQLGGTKEIMVDEGHLKITHLNLSAVSSSDESIKEPVRKDEDFRSYVVGDGQQTTTAYSSVKNDQDICEREAQRRLKIGKANKGRTPWNKGQKHSEETRARIKERTTEALSDPKVRNKMSNSRPHSEQSKAKVSLALRRIWKERLKYKRLQEKCLLLWAGSIAKAAKVGSHDQHELHWDSYEKMKANTISQQLKVKAEKAREKEIAKLRAKRAAKYRAECIKRLTKQRKQRVEKAEARKSSTLSQKKSEDEKKKKLSLSKGLKLKARLTKFHDLKKQLQNSASFQSENVNELRADMEEWDMERIKMEITRRKISLADQIQAVKNQKIEFTVQEVSADVIYSSGVGDGGGDQ